MSSAAAVSASCRVPTDALRPILAACWGTLLEQSRDDPGVALPQRLTPFAGFRASHPPLEALRAAVDADPELRERLADALDEPDGDRLGWVWLTRPPQWETQAAELTNRPGTDSSSERALRDMRQRVDRARSKAAASRETVRRVSAEHRERRRAARAAGDELAAAARRREEAERAEREARSRKRAADSAARVTRCRLDSARARAQSTQSRYDDARRSLRRLQDPEPAAAAAEITRRAERTAPAAAAVVQVRPIHLPAAVRGEPVRAAEAVLRTPGAVLVVDAYNLAFVRWDPDRRRQQTLAGIRDRTQRCVNDLAARFGVTYWMVWDGITGGSDQRAVACSPGSRIVFTDGTGNRADDEIVRICGSIPHTTPVLVVTDDTELRRRVRREAVNTVRSTSMWELLEPAAAPGRS